MLIRQHCLHQLDLIDMDSAVSCQGEFAESAASLHLHWDGHALNCNSTSATKGAGRRCSQSADRHAQCSGRGGQAIKHRASTGCGMPQATGMGPATTTTTHGNILHARCAAHTCQGAAAARRSESQRREVLAVRVQEV